MSKYTTELRYILESYAGLDESEGNDKVEEIITAGMPHLFDFTLPIFDANYATALESKICRHFYTREIGFETVGRFKLGLRTKLIEILPYYNKLYESELIKINPLQTYTVNKTHADSSASKNTDESDFNRKDKTNTSGVRTDDTNANTSSENKERFSDTPNGTLADIEDNTYLTNATINNASNKTNSKNVGTNSENGTTESSGGTMSIGKFESSSQYVEKVCGINGISESKLLKQYRNTFLNIDMMLIEELEPLFMQLW